MGDTPGLGSPDKVYESLTAASLAMATGQETEFPVGLFENQGICYDLSATAIASNPGVTCDDQDTNSVYYAAAKSIIESDLPVEGAHCTFSQLADETAAIALGEYNIATKQNGFLTSGVGESTQYWSSDDCGTDATCVPAVSSHAILQLLVIRRSLLTDCLWLRYSTTRWPQVAASPSESSTSSGTSGPCSSTSRVRLFYLPLADL